MRKIKTLKKNYEFKNVFIKGKFYIGKQITVYIMKNKKEYNVIGIAISTKTGNAVRRNRIKRLIRENYKNIKDNLKTGNNIVFLWNQKEKAQNANFYIIKNDMETLVKRGEIL